MLEIFKRNWRIYLMEAAGLGGFVLGAGMLAVFLEHPDFPAMRSSFGGEENAIWRRIPLGLIMGGYVALVTYFFGEKSGAHINPAATWAFYRLKKISFADAVFYTAAQFAGATAAALFLTYWLDEIFAHRKVDFGVTKPLPPHTSTEAFVAEFIISFALLFVLLFVISSRRLEKYVAATVGILLGLYLIFELPFSGMSLNPARSFAAAFAANKWEHLWIYFVSPMLAMLFAAEIYARTKTKFRWIADKELPDYPVEDK